MPLPACPADRFGHTEHRTETSAPASPSDLASVSVERVSPACPLLAPVSGASKLPFRFFRSGTFIQAVLSSSYSCTFTFSPFAPRSLPASPLLWAVRLPQKKTAGLPGSSTPLSSRAAPNHPGESDGCIHPLLHHSMAGFIRFDRLATLICTLTRPNRVRLRCGSRVRLARLRDGDCSHSTRLRGYVDERIISTVSSFQLTR